MNNAYILENYAREHGENDTVPAEIAAVIQVYQDMLSGWNSRDALQMAAPFTEEGGLIGFDGSEVAGRSGIEAHLTPIFAHHKTPFYYCKVKAVKLLGPETALLRSYAGLVPDGKNELDPNLNAHHTMVAVKRDGRWRIEHFQNTPAQFHMEPDRARQMTEELSQLVEENATK
ncbi:DUF4440 domain-containing protein [Paenibacillus montanisoli]|uniref:DUF4440 domain-containing protein n=2 Tax=Paenibacillus montanisoli TaxID=2081970 RepID=A0A328TUA5_9BACL|nr:DUF4440 domain-containing protein [Paenibacillus montanisoli]